MAQYSEIYPIIHLFNQYEFTERGINTNTADTHDIRNFSFFQILLVTAIISFFLQEDKDIEEFKTLKEKEIDLTEYKRPESEPKPPRASKLQFFVHTLRMREVVYYIIAFRFLLEEGRTQH